MPAGDPTLIGAFVNVIPCDAALETTPTITELCLAACPDDNVQVEIHSIGFRANTIPVDAGDPATVDIEFIDDSASDAVSNLAASFDLLTVTALVYNPIWSGRKVLDPGDVINAEFTVATPTTASEGAAFIVRGRVV